MSDMTIIDISIPIQPGMVMYPNNPEVTFDMEKGSSSVHTTVSFGTHTGTHIDAPFHASNSSQKIDEIELDRFYGKVRVFDLSHITDSVKIEDLEKYNIQKGDRVMFKTHNSMRGFDEFYDDYVYLDGDAADYLADKEIALCCIDYLSIKQKGSTDLRSHTSLLEKNIPIIEAVNLIEVEEGEYILSALPLKLKGLDGSPTRAILIKQ